MYAPQVRHVGFMWHLKKKYADRNEYAIKIGRIRPRSHIQIKPTCGNGEGGEVTKVHTGTFFRTSSPDYTNLGTSVLCGNFFYKYADHMKMKYAAEICSINIFA